MECRDLKECLHILLLEYGICNIIISIFAIMGKKTESKVVYKIGIFIFLIYCYIITIFSVSSCISSKEYSLLPVLAIIFIIEVLVTINLIFGKNIFTSIIRKLGFFDVRQFAVCLLLIAAFIVGIALVYFGIKDQNELKQKTKDYIETEGYFTDYSVYSESEDGTTYRLIYTYEVNGEEYTVSTDYGTAIIPKENSTKMIKYDENNPSEAILEGANGNNIKIYIGAFFIIIATILSVAYVRYLIRIFKK